MLRLWANMRKGVLADRSRSRRPMRINYARRLFGQTAPLRGAAGAVLLAPPDN